VHGENSKKYPDNGGKQAEFSRFLLLFEINIKIEHAVAHAIPLDVMSSRRTPEEAQLG